MDEITLAKFLSLSEKKQKIVLEYMGKLLKEEAPNKETGIDPIAEEIMSRVETAGWTRVEHPHSLATFTGEPNHVAYIIEEDKHESLLSHEKSE